MSKSSAQVLHSRPPFRGRSSGAEQRRLSGDVARHTMVAPPTPFNFLWFGRLQPLLWGCHKYDTAILRLCPHKFAVGRRKLPFVAVAKPVTSDRKLQTGWWHGRQRQPLTNSSNSSCDSTPDLSKARPTRWMVFHEAATASSVSIHALRKASPGFSGYSHSSRRLAWS